MTTNSLQVLVLGNPSRPEFRDVLPALRRTAVVTTQRNLSEANTAPELCVLLSTIPGEFSFAALQAQLARWPLTRFIMVAGPLCEGEPRTGHPWPGQVRLYWHEFTGWWALQCARLQQGNAPEWALPRTSREEDVLRQCVPVCWTELTGVIGIAATRRDGAAGTLLAMLREAGLNGCLLRQPNRDAVAGVQAILWDDDDPSEAWHERIDALRDQWPGRPLAALRNFPRVSDRDWLEAHWGAPCAIAAKPYDVDVLLATLADVCRAHRAAPLT